MDRRSFLALLGAAGMRPAPAQQTRPNIILMMTDDQRWDAMSCAGNQVLQTPHIDRLAAGGCRFTEAFCTNSLCSPSRASFLTGLYSHAHGVTGNNAGGPPPDSHLEHFYRRRGERLEDHFNNDPSSTIRPNVVTVAELLRDSGYFTAMVGKWHLKSPPRGYDYAGILPRQGYYHDPQMIVNDGPIQLRGYVDDVVTDQALEALKTRPPDQPFYLQLGFKAPHREWLPPKRYETLYDDVEIPEPETFDETLEGRPPAVGKSDMDIADLSDFVGRGLSDKTPLEARKKQNFQLLTKNYYRVLKAVDDNIGRLLDYLDEANLTEDTLVVFTSDNGFFLGEYGLYDKRMAYEASIRIPMIVRYPGHVEAGRVDSDHLVLSNDVFHTVLDYAEAEAPAATAAHGASWRPLLDGDATAWRDSFLYEYISYPEDHCVGKLRAVRDKRWKLIHYVQDPEGFELFDLETDPHERKDLYGDAAYQDQADRLRTELERLRDATDDDRSEDGAPTLPCERKSTYRWAL